MRMKAYRSCMHPFPTWALHHLFPCIILFLTYGAMLFVVVLLVYFCLVSLLLRLRYEGVRGVPLLTSWVESLVIGL